MERSIIHYQNEQIDIQKQMLRLLKSIDEKLELIVPQMEKRTDEPEKQPSNTTSLYNLFYEELEKGSK